MRIGNTVTNPGELDTKIGIYSRGVTTQAGGFKKPTPIKIDDIWSKWTNVHGQEAWLANSVQARMAATVLIRYTDKIDPTCMVQKDSQYFEIISMDDIQNQHEYIELKVQAWQPG
jgi:SPP1 family predicted phage head-tail adaptor